MICFNPAFTKMIDGTEKPKIPSKFAIHAVRYNKFRCKYYLDMELKIIAGCFLFICFSTNRDIK